MHVTATIDVSALEQRQSALLKQIEERSIPVVAESHKQSIIGLTKSGSDAFGEIFHDYSTAWAKKRAAEGYPTDVKTLRMSEGRLYKMELVGNELTYTDDKAKAIAHGQMFHPKWSWHHHFFDVSENTNEHAAEELASVLSRVR